MDHIVLNMEDDEKMIAFYSNVLELATERLAEYNAGEVPFPSVRLNANTIIDLFPKRLWQRGGEITSGTKNLNHFCIAVSKEAWQNLTERLKAHNATIEDGPVPRWGAHGPGTSIYFRDPQNNLIEARYYENQSDSKKCLLGS